MSAKPTLERLGLNDWCRYRSIRLRALESDPDAFGSTLEREVSRIPEVWQRCLGDESAAHFVVRRADLGDVGLVAGAPFSGREGAGLFSMWIAPEARGNGYARLLIDAVVAWAIAKGYRQLRLEVADENDVAIRLYERLGFRVTGVSSRLEPPRDHITEHERVKDLCD